MTKYAKTKDGIFEKTTFTINGKKYIGGIGIDILYNESDILNEANTIEELCDEFVLIREGGKPHLLRDYDDLSVLKWRTVYAAIWTDKGLIYVAKMNKKGELELL